MTYISSNDARRQNSEGLVEGFSTPAEELFLCTCHGKRWPLSMLRIENGGQRHCPNQANRQGGSIDRDILRDYDRIELERRAVDDAAAVQWPISPLEDIAAVLAILPYPQGVPIGGVGTVLIQGLNLSAADTITFSSLSVTLKSKVYSDGGTLCTLTVNGVTPRANVALIYNGSEYDDVFLVRKKGEMPMPVPTKNYEATFNVDDTLSSATLNLATDAGFEAITDVVRDAVSQNATSIAITLTKAV